ncbi:MAG TPA: AAA family ATPase [Candidatus Caccomonas pullistercoris]|nr:AAA family ATPase [Candidatus Caccomonas pullistercoris]
MDSHKHDTTDVSLYRQRELLRLEYDYEKEAFRRETQTMGIGRKVKRGDCWFPAATGRSYYNAMGRFVVEITRNSDTDIEHNFEPGRPLCFFSEDASGGINYLPVSGTVSYAEAARLVAELPDAASLTTLERAERLGVQLSFDETTYRLMFAALDEAITARTGRMAELRDMIHASLPVSRGAAQPVSLPWLNHAQEHAVSEVLRARDVAVVHGPPGTGKTTTLVEAVCEVLRRENQVLICAQSNMAVDWISEKLIERGVSVLRVGNPLRMTDEMLAHSYERRFSDHPDYPHLWALRRQIRQLYALPRRSRPASFRSKIDALREKASSLEWRIRQQLFEETRAVTCTLAGSASQLLDGLHFHTLFIDEAAQALEAACWIAIRRADRIVLAGDHQQLPPTVKCPAAARGGLSRTMMEQIVSHCPETVTLLDVQYRMNETLMTFPSRWFYGGRVKSAPEVRHRGILDFDVPATWIDTDYLDDAGQEEFVGEGYGRVNKAEAELTLQVLRDYIRRIGPDRMIDERIDFGIISPYRAQVQFLRRLLRHDEELRPFRQMMTVNTVDGFQGQERDVVLISLVRANDKGQIGFLGDLRRMNVAMTRARMKLIILGHAPTLCRHTFYKALFDYIRSLSEHEKFSGISQTTT